MNPDIISLYNSYKSGEIYGLKWDDKRNEVVKRSDIDEKTRRLVGKFGLKPQKKIMKMYVQYIINVYKTMKIKLL